MFVWLFQWALVCLAFVCCGLDAQAQGTPWVRENIVTVQIDRSVRNAFGVYTDGSDVVIHLHNNGSVPPTLIDASTGRDWLGGISQFERMRRVYDYTSEMERSDSYLSRLGCAEWRICTGLEGVDFVVMAREGSARNELQFRLLRFSTLFATVEKVFRGEDHAAPGTLPAEALVALEEVSRNSWRVRFRDAFRSVNTLEQAKRLNNSPWMDMLRASPVLTAVDGSGFDLLREVDLAACRARINSLRPKLAVVDIDAIKTLDRVVSPCADFFIHVVDWLLDIPLPERDRLARELMGVAKQTRNSDSHQLALFLGADKMGANAKDPAGSAKFNKAVNNRSGGVATIRAVKPLAKGDIDSPTSQMPLPTTDKLDSQDVVDEYRRIKETKNKALLLSYSEKKGVAQPDASSLAGTVFKVSVPDKLSDGTFEIEARHGDKIKERLMILGNYQVVVLARLESVRVDVCVRVLACLFKETQRRVSDTRSERIEFYLKRENAFQNGRLVKFGPLLPPEMGQQSSTQSHLSDVRLVLELISVNSI